MESSQHWRKKLEEEDSKIRGTKSETEDRKLTVRHHLEKGHYKGDTDERVIIHKGKRL